MNNQCPNCKIWFTPKRSTAIFCSTKCRVYFNRANKTIVNDYQWLTDAYIKAITTQNALKVKERLINLLTKIELGLIKV